MRKIVLFYDNSKSVGCDGCELIEVEDDTTDDQLSQMAVEGSEEWISSWFDIVEDDYSDNEDEIGIGEIEGWWEPYDPEKHDGRLT